MKVEIVNYARMNIDDLLNVNEQITIDDITKTLIAEWVTPTSIIFKRDADVIGILFNCAWESDNGLAVNIKNKQITEVGYQDIIL
jgi:hypothetical protein